MRTQRLENVANDILGTDLELEIALEEHGILEESVSVDEHLFIDTLARCCNTCGIWFRPAQLNDNNDCNECVIAQEF